MLHKTTVTLDGSNSSDRDGSIGAYQWRQIRGKRVSINNINNAIATFIAPRTRRGRTRTLVFELTVTDNNGASDSDQVTITVTR